MKFKLVIDKTQEETVVATVHERSRLTDEMELLVLQHDGSDRVVAYTVYGCSPSPISSASPFWTERPMPLLAAANAAA